MQTLNENNGVVLKQNMISIVIDPLLSDIDIGFMRDGKKCLVPHVHKVTISPIRDRWGLMDNVIRLHNEIPPWAALKKSKRHSHKTLTTLVDENDVPCVVCLDKYLPSLFENGILDNKVSQDDLYHPYGTLEDRSSISRVRKDKGSIWHMAKHCLLEVFVNNFLSLWLLHF